jgi:hypothetical protein
MSDLLGVRIDAGTDYAADNSALLVLATVFDGCFLSRTYLGKGTSGLFSERLIELRRIDAV